MPDDSQHIDLALHNLDVLEYIHKKADFHDWAATITFYTALHIVDAIFYVDPRVPTKHVGTHSKRKDILTGTSHYRKISTHYLMVAGVARVARYLEDKSSGQVRLFATYITPKEVEEHHIRGDLWQIIKAAGNFLKPELTKQLETKFKQYFPLVNQTPPANLRAKRTHRPRRLKSDI